MTTVLVTAQTFAQDFPAGTQAGEWRVAIKDTTGVDVEAQMVSSPAATFTNLLPGTYTAEVSRLDSSNAVLGVAMTSAAFTIAAPMVSVDVPQVVTVVVS